jgi:methylenetetrahydrofolate reductase (NADPH)
VNLSFEFFPPKSEQGLQKLIAVAKKLEQYNPDYFSVTFGAGGSTTDLTLNTVKTLQQNTKTPICPHISCIASSKSQLQALLDQYQELGITNIIALRGDLPSGSGMGSSEFTYASDLVAWIKSEYADQFKIHVAAYPEVHPESQSMRSDIMHFKNKCAQGAASAITQYFFNADAYTNFTKLAGNAVPIVPGIMPIQDITAIRRFSAMCGAQIPQWLDKALTDLQPDKSATADLVVNFTTNLCRTLLANQAPALHFYTLNKADLICRVLDGLQ